MEYQVQINNLKARLQETRARKKQQEKLIMEVENQALRVSFRLPALNDVVFHFLWHDTSCERIALATLFLCSTAL